VDRLLVVWILGAMVIGVVCGKFAPALRDRFAVAQLDGTPLPIAVGLWLMMWPVLSKVRGTHVLTKVEAGHTLCPMSAPHRSSLVASWPNDLPGWGHTGGLCMRGRGACGGTAVLPEALSDCHDLLRGRHRPVLAWHPPEGVQP
jgi:hypothetical protein